MTFSKRGAYWMAYLLALLAIYALVTVMKQPDHVDLYVPFSNNISTSQETFDGDASDFWKSLSEVEEETAEGRQTLGLEKFTFMLETSGNGTLSLRQLLGVESAVRHLQDLRRLYVILLTEENRTPTLHKTDMIQAMERRYKGLHFIYTTFENMVKGTPLEAWYAQEVWRGSVYRMEHLSDGLRFLTLFNCGGLYLDLDVIVPRWWTIRNNSVFWENSNSIASCVLAFRKGHPTLKDILEDFTANYNPHYFVENGPELVKKHYYKCSSSEDCDIVLFPQEVVSPIININMTKYFSDEEKENIMGQVEDSSALHYSNSLTKKESIRSDSKSAIASIVRQSSPLVWAEIERVGWA